MKKIMLYFIKIQNYFISLFIKYIDKYSYFDALVLVCIIITITFLFMFLLSLFFK